MRMGWRRRSLRSRFNYASLTVQAHRMGKRKPLRLRDGHYGLVTVTSRAHRVAKKVVGGEIGDLVDREEGHADNKLDEVL